MSVPDATEGKRECGAPLSTSETLNTSVKMIAEEVDAAAMVFGRDEAVSG